jgi:putative ABC transport system permease protein
MIARDLLRFAAGGMRGHRLRTVLSLIGVAIGVASVILLTSLGEGARLYVTGEFASLGSNLLIVLPGRTETLGASPMISSAPHDLTVADGEALVREVRAVRRMAPISIGTASVASGDRSRDAVVVGTTNDMLRIRHLRMGIGRYLPPGVTDAPVCVLGAKIQSELFGGANPLGETVRIGEYRFRVIGVLAARGTSIGMNMDEAVYVPVEAGMRMFNRTSLFRLMAEVRDHAAIDGAAAEVRRTLAARHDGVEDFTVLTQDAVLSTFNRILRMLTAALAGIAAVSLAVAGIGIMNVMLVSISERTPEVGLLKAIGVTDRQVTAVFLLEAALISVTGGLLGLAFGLGAGRLLRHLWSDFPVQPPVWAVVAALAVSVSIGLVFGSLPARRAARLDPVAALHSRRG